jgi:O-antigen ligase
MVCWTFAWLYPHAIGGVPDLQPQVFAITMLVLGSILVGLGRVHQYVWSGGAIVALAMWSSAYPYLGAKVAGISGLCIAGVSCALGVSLRSCRLSLKIFLFAIVLAACFNAIQGVLQFFDLTGALYGWMPIPEERGTAYGALRQRNLFATLLCVGLVSVLWLSYLRQLSYSMAWTLAAVLTLGVAASGSRTGMLELVAISVLGIYWRHAHAKPLTFTMVGQLILYVAWAVLLPYLARLHGFGFLTGADRIMQSAQDARLTIWRDSLYLIMERPWTGWGWREFAFARYQTLLQVHDYGLVEHAHNLLLQVAVEFGLPAAIVLISFAAYALFKGRAWQPDEQYKGDRPKSKSGRQFAWLIVVLIVGIHSQLEYPLWHYGFLFISGAAVGYLLPAVRIRNQSSYVKRFECTLPYLVSVGLLGVCATAWAQYDRLLPLYSLPFTNNLQLKRQLHMEAIQRAESAWLFRGALDFAILRNISVNGQSAGKVRQMTEKLIHFSPEPSVLVPLIQSSWIEEDFEALRFHGQRLCLALPSYTRLEIEGQKARSAPGYLLSKVDQCRQ